RGTAATPDFGCWRSSAAPSRGKNPNWPLRSSRCEPPGRRRFRRRWTSWPSGTPASPRSSGNVTDSGATESEADAAGAIRSQPLALSASGRSVSGRPSESRRAEPRRDQQAGEGGAAGSARHDRHARCRHGCLALRSAGGDGVASRPLRRWRLPRRASCRRSTPDGPKVRAELHMQRAVLAVILREDPDVLTLPVLAGRVLTNPRSLTGGVALA